MEWTLAVVVGGFRRDLDAAMSFKDEWNTQTRGAIPRAGYSVYLANKEQREVFCDWEAILGEQFLPGLSVKCTDAYIDISFNPKGSQK